MAVVALVAAWLANRSAPHAVAPRPALAPAPAAGSNAPPAVVAPRPTYPGGFVAHEAASLTPVERQALRQHEAAASAAAPAVAGFTGIDGKPRAFRYPDAHEAEAAERARQARRDQLMVELGADPAAFARNHRLSLDEVRAIVDGDTDFPDRLLEP